MDRRVYMTDKISLYDMELSFGVRKSYAFHLYIQQAIDPIRKPYVFNLKYSQPVIA